MPSQHSSLLPGDVVVPAHAVPRARTLIERALTASTRMERDSAAAELIGWIAGDFGVDTIALMREADARTAYPTEGN